MQKLTENEQVIMTAILAMPENYRDDINHPLIGYLAKITTMTMESVYNAVLSLETKQYIKLNRGQVKIFVVIENNEYVQIPVKEENQDAKNNN